MAQVQGRGGKDSPRKKTLFLSVSILGLVVLFLSITTALVLRPMESATRRNFVETRDGLIRQIEEFTGRRLEYGSMSPSIFGTLDIRNISLLRDDNSPVLTISRLRVSFSIWNLIRGNFEDGFHSIRLDNPVLTMDFVKDRDLGERFSSVDFSGDNLEAALPEALWPENFQFRIRNGEWGASNIGGDSAPGFFNLRNFNLDGFVRKDRIIFDGRWNALGTLVPGALDEGLGFIGPLSASMSGRAHGDFSLSSGEGSAHASIPTFQGDLFRFSPMDLSFFLVDGKLEVRKVYDRSPADLILVWDTHSGDLSVSFLAENFSPQELVTLTGSWAGYNPWIAMQFSGRALLEISGGEINYSLNLAGTNIALVAVGDENQVEIMDLNLSSDYGNIAFIGNLALNPLTPRGRLSVSNLNFMTGTANVLNAELLVSSQGGEINILGEYFSSGGVNLSGLELTIIQETANQEFAGISFFVSGTSLSGTFSLEGSLDSQSRRMEAGLRLESFSAQDIVNLSSPFTSLLTLPEFAGNSAGLVSLSSEIFFATDFVNITYNVPRIVILHQYQEDFLAFASLSGTNQRFELDQGQLTWAGGSVILQGNVNFSNLNDISFSLEASHNDLMYHVRGAILDRNLLSLQGSYGLEVFYGPAGIYGYSGYARAQAIPIPMGDELAYLRFLFSLTYDSASFWSADIEYIELIDIPAFAPNAASLRLSGSSDQNGVRVPQIHYNDGLRLLSGNLSVNWDPDYREFTLVTGMSDDESREVYGLFAVFDRDVNSLELIFNTDNMRLARINPNFSNGIATGNIRILMDSWESFQAEIKVPSLTFQIRNQMFIASAQASLDNSEFLLQELMVDYGSGLGFAMPYLRINRSEGSLKTEAFAWVSGGDQFMDLSLLGEAEFSPIISWMYVGRILDSVQGSLTFLASQNLNLDTEEPVHLVFSSVKDEYGPRISLEGGQRNMIRLRFTPEESGGGNIYAALSAPSPVRGSFTGTINSRDVDIRVPDLYVDMGSLWKFIPPQNVIAFPGGIVTASLHITGPLRDPGFYGTARASSMRIRVPQFIDEDIRPVPVHITLDGDGMRFGPVNAVVGNGSGIATGAFQFVQWIPSVFTMDFIVPQESPIPVAFDFSGVVARGRVSGDLNLAMENLNFDITGVLTAHNTQITLNSSALGFNNSRSSRVITTANMMIRTGRQVEFFWPSVEWPIIQAGADLGTGIRITSDTGADRFTVVGDLMLRSGEIFYLDRNFYLRQGSLFFNENETRFDPRISVRAEMRDQSSEGPVIISMIIDNAPLQSFVPRFESNPPLTQFEILSLLGHQQSGNLAESDRDTNALISFTADALTQFTVMRTLQREIRNYLGLDMFSFRTQALQNVVFQGIGLQSPMEHDNRVGNYFDNTTIFLGKYLGSDVFVESLFSLRYDPAKQEWGGMNLDPEIGLELRNPLFDIRMNVLLQHPENWFINDISLSLSRKWFF